MENGKSKKKESFFDGKGFYIVLALCVTVIGISAISLMLTSDRGGEAPDVGITLEQQTPLVLESMPVMKEEEPSPTEPVPEDEATVSTFTSGETFGEEPETQSWVSPVQGEIGRAYTVDALAYDQTMRDWRTHDGIDVLARKGELVRSASSGTVESVKNDDLYGTTVIIDHGDGISSVYSGLAAEPPVGAGDKVKAGEVIGSVGDTALCEIGQESHVHIAMTKDGKSVDPTEYLPN